MVLINDKKYACATCIKGHRVSGCTHTDRPLFEVKKKGRPATQCQFCREKRKASGSSGAVHTKCQCGDLKNQPAPIMLQQPGAPSGPAATVSAPVNGGAPDAPPEAVETKKGMPGSTPTFPNGLRDVHEMAAAAQALTGFAGEGNRAAERQLSSLLNPCNCMTTGKCRCCAPKRARGRSSSPRRRRDTHAQVTDSVIEMLRAKATASAAPLSDGNTTSGSSTPGHPPQPSLASLRGVNLSMTTAQHLLSPENRHHPSHTSVHKTRLYSPYAMNGHASPRHSRPRSESQSSTSSHAPGWASSSAAPSVSGASPRPPPTRIRPLADMTRFLGAVFNQDGSVATEIPRSALGLPGIHVFDAAAQNGGVKVEAMEMDVDAPVSFPTAEELIIGACACGEGCECPGCATHGNASSTSPREQGHECGESCKSCFNCTANLSIPSGVVSIEQLIQLAADNVPPNPPRARTAAQLNPFDTSVLPPASQTSEEAARAFGVVNLRPLECCNGRCQCAPGECKCDNDCCGCCVRCGCGEDSGCGDDGAGCGDDGDAVMAEGSDEGAMGSCCGGGDAVTPTSSRPSLSLQVPEAVQLSPQSPSSISPTAPQSCCGGGSSPGGLLTPPNGPAPGAASRRRHSSVSRAKESANGGPTSGRLSVSGQGGASGVQRSASLSKTPSKALALHQNPHHPRPILPKPLAANAGRLAPPRSASNSSRQPSPGNRSSASSVTSPRSTSPAVAPVQHPAPRSDLTLPPSATENAAPPPPVPSVTDRFGGMTIGGASGPAPSGTTVPIDDIATALNESDVDLMAYLSQFLGNTDDGNAGNGESSSSIPSVQVDSAGLDFSSLFSQPSGTTPRPSDYESSMGDIQTLISTALMQHRPDLSADNLNYLFNMPAINDMGGQGAGYNFGAQQSMPNVDTIMPDQQPQGVAGPERADFNSGLYFDNWTGFQSQMQVPVNSQPSRGNMSYPGSSQAAAPVPPHAQTQSQPPPQTQPQPQPQQPPDTSSNTNPNIIDLSKPLNPSDVDRILQALLTQQARQAGPQDPSAQTASTHVAPPQQQQQQHPQQQPPPQQQPQQQPQRGAETLVADVYDEFIFDSSLVPDLGGASQLGGSRPHVIPQHPDKDWLQKEWTPNLLGPSVQPE